MDLVEAQEARRILDRLYGYEVSPVLWKKVMSGLSAGRVQSVATRLVVDRERERMAFRVASYWDLEGTFDAGERHEPADVPRPAALRRRRPRRAGLATSARRRADRRGRDAKVVHLDRGRAEALAAALRDTTFAVRSVESKPYTRTPYAPFRTTTLQQEAVPQARLRRLGDDVGRAAALRERLHHLHAHRLDDAVGDGASARPGRRCASSTAPSTSPTRPRVYASKVKNAQEAHEAIRPAGDSFRTPAQTGLTGDQFRLYELIWMRTVASQMKDAVGQSVTIRLGGAASDRRGRRVLRQRPGDHLPRLPQGLRRGQRRRRQASDDPETRLPNVAEGDAVSAASVPAEGHETKPPARYTEATLIKELEEREIGRPSTYASIIGTILNRGYVYKKGTALVPAWLAFSVIRLLEEHFPRLVSYEFTARMEDVLDEIAGGRRDRNTELAEFYFGSGDVEGLKTLVTELGDIDARELATFPVGEPDDGIALRVGRYGPYLEGDRRRPVRREAGQRPRRPAARRADLGKARELLANPAGEEIELGEHPETGLRVVAKNGRYGPYVTELLPEDAPKKDRPRTGSLFKDMSLDTITLDEAVRLLSLPRVVGIDRVGRGDHRAERPLRAVPQEGHRLALAGDRGAALRHHPRRGAGDLRPAQAARARRGRRRR